MGRKTREEVLQDFQTLCKPGSHGKTRLRYHPASGSWIFDGSPAGARELEPVLAVVLGTSEAVVRTVMGHEAFFHRRKADKAIEEWVAGVEAQPSDDGPLRALVAAIAHPRTTPMDMACHIWAMKQWVWQVKRNILHNKVTYHVVPILCAATHGTGKTTVLDNLLEPLVDYTSSMRVDQLNDRFNKKLLSKNVVLRFDEFSGADKVDRNVFKSLVTGEPLQGREMYGEGGVSFDNRLSCIATSNLPPPHGFSDPTGMRRFWSIPCTETAKEHDPEACRIMDSLDYAGVWRAVSVEVEVLHDLIPAEIKRHMAHVRNDFLRARDSFESFVEDALEQVAPEHNQRLHFRDVQDLYRAYLNRCGLRRERMNYRQLMDRLKSLGHYCSKGGNQPCLHNFIERPVNDERPDEDAKVVPTQAAG